MPIGLAPRKLVAQETTGQDGEPVLRANQDVQSELTAVVNRLNDSGFFHLLQESAQVYGQKLSHRL